VGEELYDYDRDPKELTNIVADQKAGGEKDRLRLRLSEIMSQRARRSQQSAAHQEV
jgi:hypothetical protein